MKIIGFSMPSILNRKLDNYLGVYMEYLLAISYIGEIYNCQLNKGISAFICPVYFSKNWTN